MTETSNTPRDERLDRFDAALDRIGHKASGNDRRWSLGGLVAMGLGVVVAVVAYSSSTSMSDQRDILSAVILAVIGLAIVVAGAAVFIRYSLTEFLRFWMLRMLLQDSAPDTSKKS